MSVTWRILIGDVRTMLRTLPEASVHCVVTSPPYWGLRDYGVVGQLGLEATPEEYVETMTGVFREVRRVLRSDGTAWVNLGDCYGGIVGRPVPARRERGDGPTGRSSPPVRSPWPSAHASGPGSMDRTPGLKPKDLVGQPWRLAFALQADGWWLRSAITWCKRAPMPESVTDRPTSATEMIFLLSKSATYFYDADAVRESGTGVTWNSAKGWVGPKNRAAAAQGLSTRDGSSHHRDEDRTGRNLRNFWLLGPEPLAESHFAAFPSEIPRRAISAGTSAHGVCASCGAPWERVSELTEEYRKHLEDGRATDAWSTEARKGARAHGNAFGGDPSRSRVTKDARTTGWAPTCPCAAPVVPATVLDPFVGSGTSGIVAVRYGRSFVGIELNPKYAAMATRRIAAEEREFALVDHAERARPRNAPGLFPDDPP